VSAVPRDVAQLREYGAGLAEAVRDVGVQAALNFDSEWRDAAQEALAELAASGLEFTADDLRDRVGEPMSPNALGAAIRAASAADLIRHVGYRRSRRISRHAGVIGVWKGR
jgi:hypothetical protein